MYGHDGVSRGSAVLAVEGSRVCWFYPLKSYSSRSALSHLTLDLYYIIIS